MRCGASPPREPNEAVRGPEVPVDLERPATMTLEMPPGAPLIKSCALTVEPSHGNSIPKGPELAHLEL